MPPSPDEVLFVISNLGDYHAARLCHLTKALASENKRLRILELSPRSTFYSHHQPRNISLRAHLDVTQAYGTTVKTLSAVVRFIFFSKARYVIQIGYSDKFAVIGLLLARLFGKKVLFLADSKADDAPRVGWKELLKKALLPLFDGALVAGERHKRYFSSLGVPADRISTGYDVVDNEFFASQAVRYRRKAKLIRRLGLIPDRYVLVVSRLVPRKRVDLALELYARSGIAERGISLVIIGKGPAQPEIVARIEQAGLRDRVRMVPCVANTAIALYYTFAEALILASEYDQWGLSVNEAMAVGTPAFVTERCGSAGEIVEHKVDGFIWTKEALEDAALALAELVASPGLRQQWSQACKEKMAKWNLDRFSRGLITLMH